MEFEKRKVIGFFLGIISFIVVLFLLPRPEGLDPRGMAMLSVLLIMVIWWVTEALPIGATSLLPIVLYPLLGIMKSPDVTSNYGHHLIFLFFGGFIIAIAMQKHNLHRRIALHTIKFIGESPYKIVMGFMIATAFLSMWISNTATTMMMVPIAIAIIQQFALSAKYKDKSVSGVEDAVKANFGLTLMLGITYGASIGGMATLVGTPPNIALVGLLENLYPEAPEISFARWMVVALPIVIVFIPLAWWYLTRLVPCNI